MKREYKVAHLILSDYVSRQMVADVDTDGNGEIDFDEFVAMMVKKMDDNNSDEEIQECFQVLDRDQDG